MGINWADIQPLHVFVKKSDSAYIIKAMNTQRLITEYSKLITLQNCLKFYIHTLEILDDVVIGYEIVTDMNSFKLTAVGRKHLVFGTPDLKPRRPHELYEDSHLSIFKFGKDNFLFLSKNRDYD